VVATEQPAVGLKMRAQAGPPTRLAPRLHSNEPPHTPTPREIFRAEGRLEQRVRAGDQAEVLFKGIPGRVFRAKVRLLIDAVAAGQLQSTDTLVNVGGPPSGDRALAILDLVDDVSAYQVPLGAAVVTVIMVATTTVLVTLRIVPGATMNVAILTAIPATLMHPRIGGVPAPLLAMLPVPMQGWAIMV
jgi:hypothetical protein